MDEKDAVEVIRRAARVVRDADLPAQLQAEGFRVAANLLLSDYVGDSASATKSRVARLAPPRNPTANAGTLRQLTDRLGLPADLVGRIWAVEDGELHVIAPPSRLADNRRGAMREVALLTAVGRQAGGWDASTALATLRSSCDGYGPRFFDPNNFNNAVNDLGDELKKLGDGKDMRVRVTPPGFDAGIALATRLGSAVA